MLEDIPSENVAPDHNGVNSSKKSKKLHSPISAGELVSRARSTIKNKSTGKNDTPPKHTKKSQSLNASSKKDAKNVTDSKIIKETKEGGSQNNDFETKCMGTVPEEWTRPFRLGWRREIVYRGVQNPTKQNKQCDIYYFAPDNTKLRSLPMIMEHLAKVNSDLTKECFSFSKQRIHNKPQEIIRNAGEKGSVKKLNENDEVKAKKDLSKLNASLKGIENVSKTRSKVKKSREVSDDSSKEDVKRLFPKDENNEANEMKRNSKRKLENMEESPSKKAILTDEDENLQGFSIITPSPLSLDEQDENLPVTDRNTSTRADEKLVSNPIGISTSLSEDGDSEGASSKISSFMEETENTSTSSNNKDSVEDSFDEVSSRKSSTDESAPVDSSEQMEFSECNGGTESLTEDIENNQLCHGSDNENNNDYVKREIDQEDTGNSLQDSTLNCDFSEQADNEMDDASFDKESCLDVSQDMKNNTKICSDIEQKSYLSDKEIKLDDVPITLATESQSNKMSEEDIPEYKDESVLTGSKENVEDKGIGQVKNTCSMCMGVFSDEDVKEMICQSCVSIEKEKEFIKSQDSGMDNTSIGDDFVHHESGITVDTKCGKSLVEFDHFVVDLGVLQVLDTSKPFYLSVENGHRRLVEPGSLSTRVDGLYISLIRPIPPELAKTLYVDQKNVVVTVQTDDDEKQTLVIRA